MSGSTFERDIIGTNALSADSATKPFAPAEALTKPEHTWRPPAEGLYDLSQEKDSCGVGFIANIKGQKSHQIVSDAISILCNLEHRGAVGADPRAGDGAGILVQIPHGFFARKAKDLGFTLPAPGEYAVGALFMPRDTAGYRIVETWDTMGMRATRSDDTVLEGVFVPDRYIARMLPPGGADTFILGMFAWALIGFANIYCGVAQRAIELGIQAVKGKASLALSRSMAYHPEIQHAAAEMMLEFEPIVPHLDRLAQDWSNGVDHGAAWVAKIFAAKHHAVEASWQVVDLALDVAGGFGVFRRAGLERLFRDARLGRIHPANSMLTHEIVAKTLLGISPDETPRWG